MHERVVPVRTELQKAEARYARALLRLREARTAREQAIQAAARAGVSHAEIERQLGGTMTRSRVGQIARRP